MGVRNLVKETPSASITNAGLFDRKNLKLPYSKGRIVLLGDAAHPQTPFMGQGVNMAMIDAFVLATRLSRQSVDDAIRAYDSEKRRASVNQVIKQARTIGSSSVSSNRFFCMLNEFYFKYMPMSWLDGADKSNADFVRELQKDFENT